MIDKKARETAILEGVQYGDYSALDAIFDHLKKALELREAEMRVRFIAERQKRIEKIRQEMKDGTIIFSVPDGMIEEFWKSKGF